MTLFEAVPELVVSLEGALVRIGRGDVADQLREAVIGRWTYDDTADAIDLEVRSFAPSVAAGPSLRATRQGETVSAYDEAGVNLQLDDARRLVSLEIFGAAPLVDRLKAIGA
jgi:hypothetical protein